MMRRFNLVDEDWIPIAGAGRVSLKRIFQDTTLKSLGGTPVQKLSLLKLLLAIAQRVHTPENDYDWSDLKAEGLGEKCIEYLESQRDLFWLYGDRPFLQMPVLRNMLDKNKKPLKVSDIGRVYLPDLPSENDSILFQNQNSRPLTDAEKAVFIVSVMNYSPGGKRTVKDAEPLTKGYSGKTKSARAAPSIGGYVGYLNSCLWGTNVLETVWLNVLTQEHIRLFKHWTVHEIIPPWEEMPQGEDDHVANRIKHSIMGSLCAVSRFVLLEGDGIIYMEGIQYPYHTQGWREPFLSFTPEGKMLWLDTSKKPWRNLPALLQATFEGKDETSYECPQVSLLLPRARSYQDIIGIWSGGLQVRSQAGDQSVKQTDDYIESIVFLETAVLGEPWYYALKREMSALEKLSTVLYSSIRGYFSEQLTQHDTLVKKAVEIYWQLCERRFQDLVDVCSDAEKTYALRKEFASFIYQLYDRFCPRDTSRQMSAWAKQRPNLAWYLAKEKEETSG